MVDMATIVSLAELFNSLNPSYGMEKWLSILEITFNLVLNLIAARAAHEWQADMKYHYMILDSLITISDGVSCDRDSFKCESFNGE
jgi:predicted ferric reductase